MYYNRMLWLLIQVDNLKRDDDDDDGDDGDDAGDGGMGDPKPGPGG